MALGKKDRSLVLEFASVLPPSLSDARRALPTSMSFEQSVIGLGYGYGKIGQLELTMPLIML